MSRSMIPILVRVLYSNAMKAVQGIESCTKYEHEPFCADWQEFVIQLLAEC
jgi:hypothetical protein